MWIAKLTISEKRASDPISCCRRVLLSTIGSCFLLIVSSCSPPGNAPKHYDPDGVKRIRDELFRNDGADDNISGDSATGTFGSQPS